MGIKVKHLHTADGNREGSSWLEHWKIGSDEKADNCSVKGRSYKATDGAHVKKVASNDNAHYIVPMCSSCNRRRSPDDIELVKDTILVPVNLP